MLVGVATMAIVAQCLHQLDDTQDVMSLVWGQACSLPMQYHNCLPGKDSVDPPADWSGPMRKTCLYSFVPALAGMPGNLMTHA